MNNEQKPENKNIVERIIFRIIRFYQTFVSPNLKVNCRFYPSCSQYTLKTIQEYGVFKGCAKSLKRILRCHPFCQGGIDLP